MKKIITGMMLTVMCIGMFAAGNLVENGDFKAGRRNWYVAEKDSTQFIFIAADKPDGPGLKIVGAEKADEYARINNLIKLPKDVTLKTGDEVVLKANIKCVKLSGKFQVMFRQTDAKGKSLNYSGITFRKRFKCGWEEFSSKIKIKKNAVKFYIYIISTYLSSDDAVYVKNISVEKILSQKP